MNKIAIQIFTKYKKQKMLSKIKMVEQLWDIPLYIILLVSNYKAQLLTLHPEPYLRQTSWSKYGFGSLDTT